MLLFHNVAGAEKQQLMMAYLGWEVLNGGHSNHELLLPYWQF